MRIPKPRLWWGVIWPLVKILLWLAVVPVAAVVLMLAIVLLESMWYWGRIGAILDLLVIAGSFAVFVMWTVHAAKTGKLTTLKAPSMQGITKMLGYVLCIVAVGVMLNYAPSWLELHAERRTAKIRAVKGDVLYMNDGTVWELSDWVRGQARPATSEELRGFLAGDAVRYVNPAAFTYLYDVPHDDLDYCFLKDETTGRGWIIGKRLTSPFMHSSCPSHTSTGDLFWGLIKPVSWQ